MELACARQKRSAYFYEKLLEEGINDDCVALICGEGEREKEMNAEI